MLVVIIIVLLTSDPLEWDRGYKIGISKIIFSRAPCIHSIMVIKVSSMVLDTYEDVAQHGNKTNVKTNVWPYVWEQMFDQGRCLVLVNFHTGDLFYVQLVAVKTKYRITSITWPYCRFRCRTHWGLMIFKLATDQVMLLQWIAGSSIFTNFKNKPKSVNLIITSAAR